MQERNIAPCEESSNINFTYIPDDILGAGINGNELIIFSIILSYTKKYGFIECKQDYFSKKCGGISERGTCKILKKLEDKGLIKSQIIKTKGSMINKKYFAIKYVFTTEQSSIVHDRTKFYRTTEQSSIVTTEQSSVSSISENNINKLIFKNNKKENIKEKSSGKKLLYIPDMKSETYKEIDMDNFEKQILNN